MRLTRKQLVEKKEWVFPIILAVIIPLITLIPVIHGYMTEPEGKQFMGLVRGAGDSNTYFDYMNQVSEGNIIFYNSYTSEDMKALLIRPLYLVMGIFSLIIPAIITYHLFRIALSAILILVFYKFTEQFFKEKINRNLATIIFATGSGLGYFVLQLNNILPKTFGSIDLWTTEAIPFLTINGAPHFILSYILIILSAHLFLKGIEERKKKKILLAGITSLFLGFVHIYDIVTLFTMTGIYFLVKIFKNKKRFKEYFIKAVIFYSTASASSVYYFIVFTFDPIYSNWTSQNILVSAPISNYLLGFGLILCLAAISIYIQLKYKHYLKNSLFLFIWIISNALLLYFPVTFQSRFVEGLFIPLSICSAHGLAEITNKLRWSKVKKITIIVSIIILSTTNIYIYSDNFTTKHDYASKYEIPTHLDNEDLQAINWLNENSDKKDVVLADNILSNYIPRISGNRVYVGHWAQTVDFDKKIIELNSKSVPTDEIQYQIIETKEKPYEGFKEVYRNSKLVIYQKDEPRN